MDGTTRALASGFDAANNRSQITYPDSNYVTLVRDSLSRETQANLNGTGPLVSSIFGNTGALSQFRRWRASDSSWRWPTTQTPDPILRLSSLATDVNNTSQDVTTTFTYNPASEIASQARDNDLYAWPGQVAVSRAYTANGSNQYSAVGGTSQAYDTDGNLTSDGTNSYVYDVENRLVSATVGGASATLRYDPLGRLYEVNGSATGITRFLDDGDDLVGEYNSSGTLLRRYVHGDGSGDDPQVWFEGSGVADATRRYLYADERGSVVAVTDSAGNILTNGSLTAINSYDEYGIPDSTDIATKGRFRYTGQAFIPELGMYYYKARMYSPTLGRFMQTDPIGYGDGMNMYRYAANDPVNFIDPTGLDKVECDPNQICVSASRTHLKGNDTLPSGSVGFHGRVQGGGSNRGCTGKGTKGRNCQKDTSVSHCAKVAAVAHRWQILADIASAVPAGRLVSAFGKTLSGTTTGVVAASQWHLAFGSGLVSAIHGNGAGVGLAAGGYGLVVADLAKEGASFIPYVGFVVGAAAVANDIFGSEEYQACRAGQ